MVALDQLRIDTYHVRGVQVRVISSEIDFVKALQVHLICFSI